MMADRHPYLGARHRSAHERHGPARLHEHRTLRRMRIARDEPSWRKPLQGERKLVGIVAPRVAECEAVEDVCRVSVDLQAPEAPEAGIAEGAVVEVHGVLRGDDDADAKRAGLFHEGDERPFGGWIGRVGR